MNTGMEPTLRADVWSDYVCPFCYLQLPLLEELQNRYGASIDWHWHAFELRPEPLSLPDPNADYLRMTWSRAVLPMADRRRLPMRMPTIQPRSRLAQEAAHFARGHGHFSELHRALFRAFFEEGQDIGQSAVLVATAEAVGLPRGALEQSLREGDQRPEVMRDEAMANDLGLRAVPVMLLRRVDQPLCEARVLSGTQPLQRLTEAIDALLA
ncbi:DsbA family protein [uncultured Pseudomonas sp.]|uniref:DsbA family oxidoreductase n=1 Tax=uncultured Pseudomonas sp. TaxID=114707 RepID=UPI0025CFFEA6|nr:DsbA family protein [uncultured Pseudomonas sp.]